MNLLDRLEGAVGENRVTAAQAAAIRAAESGEPFSIHAEIRALMYVGVLFIAAGAAATVKTYFDAWGPLAIVGGLSTGSLACFAYAVRRGAPWSRERVGAPTAAADYALFLGCLLLVADVGYVEARWRLLAGDWQRHLLASAGLFLALAYRYDNRLVLSLGLSSLAAWLGLEMKTFGLAFYAAHRAYALLFGLLCAGVGALTHREGVKAHFLDVYLNFAAHFLGAALLSGVFHFRTASFHFYVLALACGLGAVYAFRSRRFLYLAYAVLYGYAGVSSVLLRWRFLDSIGFFFLYFILSSVALMGFLFWASREMKEEG